MAEPAFVSPISADESDRRLLRRSLVFSVAFHVAVTLLVGVALRSNSKALQVSPGFVVDLIEIPEAVARVEAPDPGIRATRTSDIPLPRDRRLPKSKPRPIEERRPPQPVAAPKQAETAPVKAPPETEPRPGAGGRMEAEVPFPFDYYTETITRLILSRWAPYAGSADSTQAVVRFTILRTGEFTGVEVTDGSGNTMFDRGAVSAIRNVGRFPPLPQGFEWDRLAVRFHFEYRRGYR